MEGEAGILIVDDDSGFRRSMSLVLKGLGYPVCAAKDGHEALAKASETDFSVVFMDIKMPLMDGVEAYKGIKGIRPDAVVIMMTAYGDERLIDEAMREGAFKVIRKPLDLEEISELIWRASVKSRGVSVALSDDHSAI